MRLSLLKADTWNIPLKIKNKPFKSLFTFRGVIIPISGENAIESKKEANKTIFLISFQVYQRYQDGKSYLLNIIQQKLQILQKGFYPLFSFNSSISFCILPALFKLNKKPYNENEKDIISISSAIELSILKNAKKLPLNPADHKIILSLIIEYSAFKISNLLLIISLYRTYLFFYIVNDFSFLVVIKPSNSPFWNFIFGLPSCRNSSVINTSHITKFFNCKTTYFELIFKFLIIHCKPLNFIILNFIKK